MAGASRCGVVVAVLAGLVALAAAPAATALEEWDQARVTALAGELHQAVKKVREQVRLDPGASTPTQSKKRADLDQKLRELDRSCTQLARKLEAGEGRDETFGLARKLRTQVRDIDVVWRVTFLTEGSKSATEPAVAAMRALGPYYFEPE